ncbi:MAG TPA: alpha/beta fold hydrolase, partial [Gemmatimonadaceae bacterium]|nr:alpha/beta fold hydrolase [Gemmatimonadaceae bacterium]
GPMPITTSGATPGARATRRAAPATLALILAGGLACGPAGASRGRAVPSPAAAAPAALADTAPLPRPDFAQQAMFKQLRDLAMFTQLVPEMLVRKVYYSGEDKLVIPAYVFAPRDTTVRYPLVILVHGGIHGDFDAVHVPQVRSLVAQGYVVIAPEYRGSTGYGPAHYDAIDYGGKEVEDVMWAREYAGALLSFADTSRTGIMGWSHGGFIALHSIFRRPEWFKVAVAHVPVADLPTRIRTHNERYHQLFIRQPGFGARLEQNPRPYIERSPIAHVRKLKTPLLVLTADNDDDVFIIENHNLRDSMRVAGMEANGLYTYREWHEPTGGHSFSIMDTREGREAWQLAVDFLNRRLAPTRREERAGGAR